MTTRAQIGKSPPATLRVAVILAPGRRPRTGSDASPEASLRYLHPLLDELAQHVDLTLFAGLPSRNDLRYKICGLPGKTVRTPGAKRGYDPSVSLVSPTMVAHLLRGRFDAVVAFEYSLATLWSLCAARMHGSVSFIFQEHISNLSTGRRATRKLLGKLAGYGLANTAEAERSLIEEVGFSRSRVARAPLLVPPSAGFLKRIAVDPPTTQRRPIFLAVGQLTERKNLETLVAAVEQVMRRCDETFSVWIAGDGPLRPSLERQITSRSLSGVISLLGDIPYGGIGYLYEACDVFVHPTHTDYRAVAVLEAMSFARPVILSRGDGSAGTLVNDGIEGWLFDPRSVAQLARAIETCVLRADSLSVMGSRAAAAVCELQPSLAATRLVDILHRAIEGHAL